MIKLFTNYFRNIEKDQYISSLYINYQVSNRARALFINKIFIINITILFLFLFIIIIYNKLTSYFIR